MRVSSPTMILSLATLLMCLGWSAVPADAEEPGMSQISDDSATPCPGPNEGQGQRLGWLRALGACCDADDCGPRWTFTGEGVVIQRSSTRSQLLFTDRLSLLQLPSVDSKDRYSPAEFGPRVSAIHHGPCGWDLEVAYFQVDGFAANTFVSGTSTMVTDTGPGTTVTSANARYTSALYSGEVNARQVCNEWLTLLGGFRMIELNEHYNAEGTGTLLTVPVTSNVNAFNNLYGFQIGADAEIYNMRGPLVINALCKAGIYDNFASQNISRVYPNISNDSLSAQRDWAAFLGEVRLVATYSLTKRLAFRASCEAAWLEGVALAPEQIGATNFQSATTAVDTAGGVFYYGCGLGAEYRF